MESRDTYLYLDSDSDLMGFQFTKSSGKSSFSFYSQIHILPPVDRLRFTYLLSITFDVNSGKYIYFQTRARVCIQWKQLPSGENVDSCFALDADGHVRV